MKESFYVAGFKFHEGLLKIQKDNINNGDVVTLVPDPENPYDENAIEVHHNDSMIGFVPKAINQRFDDVFEHEAEIIGTVAEVNKDTALDEPWKAVRVLVDYAEED